MAHKTEIGAFEAKNTLGTLLDRVERGEEIVITRHGKAVARLVPNMNRIDQQQASTALQRIRDRAKKLHQTKAGGVPFDWPALKEMRDHGRR
jgi:prevent-host-death family protein